MRLVHDVVALTNKAHTKRAVIAFIQHGTVEDGWKYEVVCPFCALTIGHVEDKEDMLTTEQLYKEVYNVTNTHMKSCSGGGFKLVVAKAVKPLGVDKLVKEH